MEFERAIFTGDGDRAATAFADLIRAGDLQISTDAREFLDDAIHGRDAQTRLLDKLGRSRPQGCRG
ncbi:hypothetical protein FJU11_03010 [Pararhizobium mangrovi]|uniref:Uncharacterized protein n=1 Tax=Pararhizobium mangrovi TaxID=2590452 RepID=A0A506UE09_9HYPH|nr:hypothetical protein FJU11_03010 [Pararhizobium mangrovi]